MNLAKDVALGARRRWTFGYNEFLDLIENSLGQDADMYRIVEVVRPELKQCSICDHWLSMGDYFADVCPDVCKYCYKIWTATK
ncbi:unnamed protein product, partial [marine sediment metagenome]